jgi:hypothetical protein
MQPNKQTQDGKAFVREIGSSYFSEQKEQELRGDAAEARARILTARAKENISASA